MANDSRQEPYRGYRFTVDDISVQTGFSECSGLTFDTDPVEYREGKDEPHVRKLRGLRKYANIVLKRGISKDLSLWNWYLDVINGADKPKDGAIVLHNEKGEPVLRWQFYGGWICKWEGPSLNATSNDVAIESIEICVERVELEAA